MIEVIRLATLYALHYKLLMGTFYFIYKDMNLLKIFIVFFAINLNASIFNSLLGTNKISIINNKIATIEKQHVKRRNNSYPDTSKEIRVANYLFKYNEALALLNTEPTSFWLANLDIIGSYRALAGEFFRFIDLSSIATSFARPKKDPSIITIDDLLDAVFADQKIDTLNYDHLESIFPTPRINPTDRIKAAAYNILFPELVNSRATEGVSVGRYRDFINKFHQRTGEDRFKFLHGLFWKQVNSFYDKYDGSFRNTNSASAIVRTYVVFEMLIEAARSKKSDNFLHSELNRYLVNGRYGLRRLIEVADYMASNSTKYINEKYSYNPDLLIFISGVNRIFWSDATSYTNLITALEKSKQNTNPDKKVEIGYALDRLYGLNPIKDVPEILIDAAWNNRFIKWLNSLLPKSKK